MRIEFHRLLPLLNMCDESRMSLQFTSTRPSSICPLSATRANKESICLYNIAQRSRACTLLRADVVSLQLDSHSVSSLSEAQIAGFFCSQFRRVERSNRTVLTCIISIRGSPNQTAHDTTASRRAYSTSNTPMACAFRRYQGHTEPFRYVYKVKQLSIGFGERLSVYMRADCGVVGSVEKRSNTEKFAGVLRELPP